LGKLLLIVEYSGSNPGDKPQNNLEIWDVKTEQRVYSCIQRKQRDWLATFVYILFMCGVWLVSYVCISYICCLLLGKVSPWSYCIKWNLVFWKWIWYCRNER